MNYLLEDTNVKCLLSPGAGQFGTSRAAASLQALWRRLLAATAALQLLAVAAAHLACLLAGPPYLHALQPETPLLRLSWNKQDPRYIAGGCCLPCAMGLATAAVAAGGMPRPQPLQPCVLHEHWLSLAVPAALAMDSARVMVLDIRYPTMPVAELQRHQVRPEQRCGGGGGPAGKALVGRVHVA